MKSLLIASIGALSLLACATAPADPAAQAERACSNFARLEGTRLVAVQAVEPAATADANFRVKLAVEDGLSRRINVECLYSSAGNQARWAAPLPRGFVRI